MDGGLLSNLRLTFRAVLTALVAGGLLSGCATSRMRQVNPPSTAGTVSARAASAARGSDRKAADPKLVPTSLEAADGPESISGIPLDFTTPAIPAPAREFPIDLTTALRLAEAENPQIAQARQMIGEALAVQQKARVLLLPNLNAGVTYHSHTGNLERSSGTILNLNKKSLYFGAGADAITAGPVEIPGVSILSPLTDAIFQPLAARQKVAAARFDAATANNNILREVAELHFDLLAAEADLQVRRETAAQEAEVARLTRAYADANQGREADAERAATELSLVEIEVRQAEEDVAVAAVRLARRLHLDQAVRLRPIAPAVEQVTLIDPSVPLPELIAAAIRNRPESGSRAAAIMAAEYRHKEELCRPLLPTLGLGFSGGVFGGGSNLVGPSLAHFASRTDFDVMAFWTLKNFGFGNLALQKERKAEIGQAAGEQARVISQIRSEVAAAHAAAAAAKNRIGVTTRQLASAKLGFQEDLQRIRNTVGRPIEAVNSLELLNHARVDRIQAVLEYNKAEVRLFVSLASPPPLEKPVDGPLPVAPIAEPPLPPLDGLVAGRH